MGGQAMRITADTTVLVRAVTGDDRRDRVIAFEGSRLGAEVFVSFGKKAARLMQAQGAPVRLLA